MKPPRSALPLPRYVRRMSLRSGWAYFFCPPTWAKKAGCPIRNEPLGTDYAEAVQRAETVLLPSFDAWRGRGNAPQQGPAPCAPAKPGTLDWLFAEYRASRRFTKLPTRSRRDYEGRMRLVGGVVMNDGRRIGSVALRAITPAVADALYEKLCVVRETGADGVMVERERRATAFMAMKICRRAWFVAARNHPIAVPPVNPFARMGLESSQRETAAATFEELQQFRAQAIAMGYSSLATAALVGWEWSQRAKDVFATFEVAHYRPREHPNAVHVIHSKTGEEAWIPLLDDAGASLFPELMAELDAIKRERIGGLMIVRDWGDRSPWPTWSSPDNPELTFMIAKVRKVMRAAGLREVLSFTSFRHGGRTEMGDADLNDAQIRAQSRHRSPKILQRYVHRTVKQIADGTKKRRAVRKVAEE
jgi:hypothetical protein